MRAFLLTTLILTYVLSGLAQSDAGSLLANWQDESLSDTARLTALNAFILNSLLESDPDSAVRLADEGYNYAVRNELISAQGEALLIRGRAYNQQGQYEMAESDIMRSITIFDSLDQVVRLAESLSYLDEKVTEEVSFG